VTDISPVKSTQKLRPQFNRSIHSCPVDPNSVATFAVSDNPGIPVVGVFVSRSNGDSWVELASGGAAYGFVEIDGANRDVIYLCGESGAVAFVGDFATIDSRVGNLVTAGRNIRLYGI
jgi:hypothetical protein